MVKQFKKAFDLIIKIFVWIAASFIQGIPSLVFSAVIVTKDKVSNKYLMIYGIPILTCFTVIVLMIFAYQKTHCVRSQKVTIKKDNWKWILIAFVATIIVNITSAPFMHNSGNANVNSLSSMTVLPLLFFFYSLIVAPITEELLFRGYLIDWFFRKKPYLGVIVSGVVFGLCHGTSDPIYLISKILIGLILGFTYVKCSTIKADVTVHVLNNLSAFILPFVVPWL